MTPIIETEDLTKRYAALRGEGTLAVDRLSVQVEAGQVYGFLGPNGCGKTTTIGMLLGIITPTAGNVRLFGGGSPAELHAARQRIGATLEYPNFYPYLNCRDNLRLVARVKGSDDEEIARILDTVGLASRQKTKFKACSLGMKQRLALAATMIGDPELIILDEPANGLDPAGQREIREIIGELARRGTTIFLSSHMLHEVQRTCTHVAIVESGRVVREGSVSEMTSTRLVAAVGAEVDLGTLQAAVSEFDGVSEVRAEGGRVLAQFAEAGVAARPGGGEAAGSSDGAAGGRGAREDGTAGEGGAGEEGAAGGNGARDDGAAREGGARADEGGVARRLAELNRFLAGRGIYASHLSLEHRSLEDAFMEITRGAQTDRGFGEVQ